VSEIYNTKNEKSHPYKELVGKLLGHFDSYTIENIPRANNKYAYSMASETSFTPIEI